MTQVNKSQIRDQVMKRYRRRFRLVVQLTLTVPIVAICIAIGNNISPVIAACLFVGWFSNILIHVLWVWNIEAAERVIRYEIRRQGELSNLAYDKPKRGTFRLTDDGELAEALYEENQAKTKVKANGEGS